MSVARILQTARANYAAAPSHAELWQTIDEGCVCAVTAVTKAAGYDENPNEALDYVRSAVEAKGYKLTNLVEFNASHTTGEVLAVFDTAIQLAVSA